MLKIKVTDLRGSRLSLIQALARNLLLILCSIPFGMGVIAIFFSKKRQGLHDLFARTLVVQNHSIFTEPTATAIPCPHCQTELELNQEEKQVGTLECPECGKQIVISELKHPVG